VQTLLALLVGVLYTAGIYLIMRRSLVKVLVGLMLLGHAANLLIFTAARVTRVNPPLVRLGEHVPAEPFADPLPQALILTAIVIGFGLQAFTLVLFRRAYQTVGNDDVDRMKATDSEEPIEVAVPR
jgi:multicomponent Na+:H+ antiporter subunit C